MQTAKSFIKPKKGEADPESRDLLKEFLKKKSKNP